jgi:hypothetical protein
MESVNLVKSVVMLMEKMSLENHTINCQLKPVEMEKHKME